MKNLNAFDWAALLLLVVGGFNWGIISMFNVNVISSIFGDMTVFTRFLYGIVGLSSLYALYILSVKTEDESDTMSKLSTLNN